MAVEGGYVVGQVAGLLTAEKQSNSQKKGLQKNEKKLKKLASLFTVIESKKQKTVTSPKPVVSSTHQEGFSPPPGVVHEALVKSDRELKVAMKRKAGKDEDDKPLTKRPRRNRRHRATDCRTVFVGNLPITVTKKILKKLFKTAGAIESVRLRCAAPAELKVSKKVAVIKQEFHPERDNISAFVVYKQAESAQEATKLNGEVIESHHVRVDLASKDKQHDHGRSVFVGNLPFDVAEEEVWEHFAECGEVENVRLVRDRHTSIGKGFGYVLFRDKSSVSLALKFGRSELKGRKLRIEHSTEHPTKSVKATKGTKEKAPRPKFKSPSNQISSSFQGDKAKQAEKVKEKKKRLWKKKKTRLEQFKSEKVHVTEHAKGVKEKSTEIDKTNKTKKRAMGKQFRIERAKLKKVSSSKKLHGHKTRAKQKS